MAKTLVFDSEEEEGVGKHEFPVGGIIQTEGFEGAKRLLNGKNVSLSKLLNYYYEQGLRYLWKEL